MNQFFETRAPAIKGLVLAGGRSVRMGQDKGLIPWHGKPQREYLVLLLESLGLPAYISCRPDQAADLEAYPVIVDQLADQGPLGAIYSAFQTDPQSAWLVLACDMPLLDAGVIRYLLEQRNPALAATAYRAPAFSDHSPDPLAAIWEPAILPVIERRLLAGLRCARKALVEAGVHVLDAPDPLKLSNVNTPEDLDRMR